MDLSYAASRSHFKLFALQEDIINNRFISAETRASRGTRYRKFHFSSTPNSIRRKSERNKLRLLRTVCGHRTDRFRVSRRFLALTYIVFFSFLENTLAVPYWSHSWNNKNNNKNNNILLKEKHLRIIFQRYDTLDFFCFFCVIIF